jgi:glutamyl-tRNA synthetase
MGLKEEDYPVFAHLPFVMGADNAKLSKRNGEVSIAWYRDKGFLPEAICNYLALLGWSPGDDREDLTMKELCELFTVEKVNSSPAKFDMKKLEAINGDKIRALTIDHFLEWALPFLIKAKTITGTPDEVDLVKRALPIIQERIIMFSEIPAMLAFLFVKEFAIESDSVAKVTDSGAKEVLNRSLKELEPISDWTHTAIEAALRSSLIEEMGLKPRIAFTALRIATTGGTISPPLFESMELLGKEASLARISAALTL